MNVRVKAFNLGGAIAKGEVVEQRVRTAVSLRVREDCKDYVPYRSGALRATAETESVPEAGQVIWGNSSVPYAAAQYYGKPNKTFPGTCMQWFEQAKAEHMIQWEREAAAEAVREVF